MTVVLGAEGQIASRSVPLLPELAEAVIFLNYILGAEGQITGKRDFYNPLT